MSYHSAFSGPWRAVLGLLEELSQPLTLGTYHAALQALQGDAWPCGLHLLQAEASSSLISYNLAIQGLDWQLALALLTKAKRRQLQPASFLKHGERIEF